MPYKKVIIILSLIILYLSFPLVWLVSDTTADSMVAEFAYRRIADRFDTTEALNSWIYVNEEQSLLWMKEDAIDKNCLFDLVRGIGWCDQKSFLLTKLLAIKGIEAKSIIFPCHTFVQVGDKYYDPTFNKTEYYQGNCIEGVIPKVSGSNLTLMNTAYNIIYRSYPKEYVDLWLDLYVLRLDNLDFTNVKLSDYYRDIYTDPDYLPLYKARLYHIYGLYDKVNYSVSPKFYEESWFYSMVLDLDTGNPIDKHLELARNGKGYLSMIDPYLKRYNEVYR